MQHGNMFWTHIIIDTVPKPRARVDDCMRRLKIGHLLEFIGKKCDDDESLTGRKWMCCATLKQPSFIAEVSFILLFWIPVILSKWFMWWNMGESIYICRPKRRVQYLKMFARTRALSLHGGTSVIIVRLFHLSFFTARVGKFSLTRSGGVTRAWIGATIQIMSRRRNRCPDRHSRDEVFTRICSSSTILPQCGSMNSYSHAARRKKKESNGNWLRWYNVSRRRKELPLGDGWKWDEVRQLPCWWMRLTLFSFLSCGVHVIIVIIFF